MLSIRNYRKSYHNQLVLNIPKLDIDHGIYWIKGDNGSGKSTLFKSVSGIISFEGECRFDEIDLKKNTTEYRSIVSYSEAEPIFPEFLTQKDLVKFVSNCRRMGDIETQNLISRFGTQDYYHQSVGTYSSGMLKKIGLIMAFIGSPKLIILDEPFTTIDAETRSSLIALIQERYESGVTFLISSHVTSGDRQLAVNKSFLVSNKSLKEEA